MGSRSRTPTKEKVPLVYAGQSGDSAGCLPTDKIAAL
jgi:hypothetical protein